MVSVKGGYSYRVVSVQGLAILIGQIVPAGSSLPTVVRTKLAFVIMATSCKKSLTLILSD